MSGIYALQRMLPVRTIVLLLALVANAAWAETYFVAPTGGMAATGSRSDPLHSIRTALERAKPGDTIVLAPGRYFQDIRTMRNGRPGHPIVITAGRSAILSGAGANRIVQINHDSIELHGFTIDGRHSAAESKNSYRDKLTDAIGSQPGDGVTGLRIVHMNLRNAGGECVRLRYYAQRNEIANLTIENCGIHDFVYKEGGKNGEGVYIGTAPEQLGLRFRSHVQENDAKTAFQVSLTSPGRCC